MTNTQIKLKKKQILTAICFVGLDEHNNSTPYSQILATEKASI
jgi:hypothetical protein